MNWPAISISILLFITGVAALQFLLGIMPQQLQRDTTPAAHGLDYQEITLETADGLSLAGWWIPADSNTSKTIIVGHGYPAAKSDILNAVTFLHSDYNLLLFDFRSFGDSQGSYTTIGHDEQQDLSAAINWVSENHPDHQIGLYGFSMSAAVFIDAQPDNVDAIIADSPYRSLHRQLERVYQLFPGPLKQPFVWTTAAYTQLFLGFWPSAVAPEQAVRQLNTPLLLIHGNKDTQIPAGDSRAIYQNADRNMTQLWIVEGASHVHAKDVQPDTYQARVRGFLEEHMSHG